MALSRKIEISDFSVGLISDLDSAELPLSAASRLENADVRNKKLETQPGILEVNTGLPTGFIKLSEQQFQFTVPSEQNCVLVHGTLSGTHKLYIRPYLSLAGAWVDSWQELSEKEGNYTDSVVAGGPPQTIQSNSLLSTTTDYYKGWIVYCATSSRGAAIVTGYNGTTKTLTLSWVIGSMASGNTFFICRNPIYETNGLCLFAPSSSGCRFLQRDNSIDIVTGGDYVYGDSDASRKSDLWLGVLNGYQAVNDSDLNFTGFYLSVKPPAVLSPGMISISAQTLGSAETEVPVPTSPKIGYVVLPVAVYDNFQEGPRYKGGSVLSNKPTDGTYYVRGSGFTITGLAASRKIQIDITLQYGATAIAFVPQLQPQSGTIADLVQTFPTLNRRISHIRFYAAEIKDGGNDGLSDYGNVVGEWRFVEEVKINSALWSGSGPSYTQTIYITGEEWAAGEGIDISDRQGHNSLKDHVNANFIASSSESVAVASVYADQKRQSFVFFAAKNSDNLVMSSVFPHTSFRDLSTFGIPAIKAFVESLGFYIAFGENILVKIDGTTFGVDNNIQAYGTSSANAVKNVNRLIYFAGLDDCFYYHPAQNVVRSLMTGFVREAWRALSTSDKQAAAIGFDGRYNVLVIAAGTSIFTYNLPAAFASDLAQDTQAVGSWNVYSVGKTFLKFYTDLTKRCIGIASDGKSYELFSSGAANTMVYEKIIGENNLNLHSLRLTYEASATVTVKIFDMARNENYPVQTFKFPAQSKHRRVDLHRGVQARRPKLRVEASTGTVISQLVINPQLIADEK